MHGETHETELRRNTQQLLDGPLKHVRAAALAAALVPLASLAAAPASAQTTCQSGGTVCGFVFNDPNHNGIQDPGETGLEGVTVKLTDGTTSVTTETGPEGLYSFFVPDGSYTITAEVPVGYTASPPDVGTDDTVDSDGEPDGLGGSVATGVVVVFDNPNTDFGFSVTEVANPGTGTPGYWKNHPEAWPDSSITIGGTTYSKDDAIYWMQRIGKDKTTLMFAQLVSAMLNVKIGNDSSCISSTITAANDWMAAYGPVGSNVLASSAAWSTGNPLASTLDEYNNGRSCAPHRQ
jgi:hypothetical protein